jgi:hypothetical protein
MDIFVSKANPSEDRLHVQRLFYFTGKPIQRFFAKLFPQMQLRWRSELVKRPCGAEELMAEAIVIEKPMQIGSEYACIGAYAPIILVTRTQA